ncbi:uncharacterized protein [Diabrotica undecimpunctata]|uniref:uncharacterized protein n=1 Tax=Diabrotica undecimpunctata TaxID=50387 RepID=UPI003B63BCE9
MMEVLVQWRDRSICLVCTNKLEVVNKDDTFKNGTRVKMLHNERWYFGIILDMKGYCGGSSSEENEPLTNTEIGSESDNTDNSEKNNKKSSDHLNNGDPYSDIDLSDTNDPTYTQCCEVPKCKGEVFSSCFRCQILLCWNHFMEDLPTCDKHRNQDSSDDSFVSKRRYRKKKKIDNRKPEDYNVEGASKEYEREVLTRTNKKRVAQVLRRSGAQYVSVDTKKTVSGRKLGSSCNSEWCKKGGRNCSKFSKEVRQSIFDNFYKLANVQLQREYIARHVKQVKKKFAQLQISNLGVRTLTYFFFLWMETLSRCVVHFL